MKLLITRYKAGGKFYDCEDTDLTDVYDIEEKYKNWNGYITVHSVEKDGFEQPIRLIKCKL